MIIDKVLIERFKYSKFFKSAIPFTALAKLCHRLCKIVNDGYYLYIPITGI